MCAQCNIVNSHFTVKIGRLGELRHHCICRDWAGPVISGAVIKETNFGWTMTVYFFSSVAVIVAVLGLKIYQAVQRCCHKNSRELLVVDNQSGHNERTPLLTST